MHHVFRICTALTLLAGLLLSATQAHAQVFVGPNLGPALGRTVEIGVMAYPKNEDWISFLASGGYTFPGPMYFPRRQADCLSHFYNNGWHVRLGARNGLTTDHHSSHMFWGLDLTFSRQNESAVLNTCDTASLPIDHFEQSFNAWSGGLNVGYTWNPLARKTIHQKFLVDFGLRVTYPFRFSQTPLGERDYFSGVGFTWLPFRSIAFEPIAVIRWELIHSRYGYKKGKTQKRYK
jgi:hypothetical protein